MIENWTNGEYSHLLSDPIRLLPRTIAFLPLSWYQNEGKKHKISCIIWTRIRCALRYFSVHTSRKRSTWIENQSNSTYYYFEWNCAFHWNEVCLHFNIFTVLSIFIQSSYWCVSSDHNFIGLVGGRLRRISIPVIQVVLDDCDLLLIVSFRTNHHNRTKMPSLCPVDREAAFATWTYRE